MFVQLFQFLPERGKKPYYTKKLRVNSVGIDQKTKHPVQTRAELDYHLLEHSDFFKSSYALVKSNDRLIDEYIITSSLCTIDDDSRFFVSDIKVSDEQVTLNIPIGIENFEKVSKKRLKLNRK